MVKHWQIIATADFGICKQYECKRYENCSWYIMSADCVKLDGIKSGCIKLDCIRLDCIKARLYHCRRSVRESAAGGGRL